MWCKVSHFVKICMLHLRASDLGIHDDVMKWKHFPRYWPFVQGIHRSQVKSPHKGQWRRALMFSLICIWINVWVNNSPHKGQRRGALMFSLICVWINVWVNNHEAGDLRRYRTHYDVIVMLAFKNWIYDILFALLTWPKSYQTATAKLSFFLPFST